MSLDAAWSRRCRLGGERVDHGWVGRAAPVLGGGPAVTGGGAGRPGPADPGGSRGLGRRVDRRPLAATVKLNGETVVAALDLPLDSVVGHVLDAYAAGVTVVLTLDPAGCIVVTLIG